MTKLFEKEKAIEMRKNGYSISKISEELKTSKNSICKWVKGIVLSDRQKNDIDSSHNLYNYNVEIFQNPDKITYYLLGAFISDGSVDPNKRRITLTSKDEEWLIKIKNIICPELPIKKDKRNLNCFELRINNKFIVNWFMQNNCIPNKSLTVKMPNIPNAYFSNFVRGVFDGDGSISLFKIKNSKTKRISAYIVSASIDFAKELYNKINQFGIEGKIVTISGKNKSIFGREPKNYNDCYRIGFRSSNAVNFCKWIYEDKTDNSFLKRKNDIYNEYVNIREWELQNCMIRKQFEDYNEILELLKNNTYEKVGELYGITAKTVIDRLKKKNLYKKDRNYV